MDVGLQAEVLFRRGSGELSVTLSARTGEVNVLVGPSGSGKTTLLRLLAGLLRPAAGVIRVNGTDWYRRDTGLDLPPQRRRVGMVFQDYALFPHLSALENVAFARRGMESRRAGLRNAAQWLERVHMQGLEQRRPHELSGGQRQRVAVARALAREPDLLLLDEPFSAVDQVVRRKLREELLDLTGSLRCAVVMVTHDLAEAAMLGARIGVMHRGRLLQLGTREEVFYSPASAQVARLMEVRNLLPARVQSWSDGEASVAWAGRTFVAAATSPLRSGDSVWMGVRPEHVLVVRQDGPARPNEVSGSVRRLLHLGSLVRVLVQPEGAPEELTLEFSEHLIPRFQVREGGPVRVSLWRERLHLMPGHAPTDGPSSDMQEIHE